jgi:putative hemolysin
MSEIAVEAVLIVALVLTNGALAMSEMAVVSARKARLQQLAARGDAGARTALALSEDPGRFLSTIQIGITLVGILTGAFGGATVAEQLALRLERVPVLAPYAEAIGLVLVVVAITYVSLIFGELVPKRLALANAERVAATMAPPMRLLSVVAAPAVKLLSLSTEGVVRLLRVRPSGDAPVTEEEITIMVEQGTTAGVFHAAERDLVARVLSLDERRVGELMTPRTRVHWIDVNDPPEDAWRAMAEGAHSYYPICDGNPDSVLGIVSVRDLWAQGVAGRAPDLRRALRPAVFVPESARAIQVLETFRAAARVADEGDRLEVALVVGEHGGLEGLVTLTDLLEAIVGDLDAEPPSAEGVLAGAAPDGAWVVGGLESADLIKEQYKLQELPQEEGYHTVGGLVMTLLGRVPASGDRVEWNGLRFEVLEMEGHRVASVRVSPAPLSGAHPAQLAPPEQVAQPVPPAPPHPEAR